ncbi:hypothetical protein NP233_g3480 [Leucocoprinus birnbaumii]|uniref:Carboxypeptidase n=1 Tax=Leucocoprinus birnbaumii TaxID=56174 RepID=A0AAD5VX58_9AGAR|nr:hypothetical protein NP233_g3480 [Leucocoprinus birnbaumii]
MLSHPAFPRHSVRIKKSHEFCDSTVNSYTGYIDIEARHIFFYFFESRNDPDTDDVIFWTNGGPGCSSSMGLFMELGPCRVKDENSTVFHPESWNTNANIFFVDQPVGVGFSYAEHGEAVGTTEEAAKDITSFVAIFFEHFSKFKGRAFHMAGESYGGRYVPVFAAEVYDQNARLVEAGLTPINLQSVMIGNGVFDFASLYLSYYDMQCTPASVPPVMSISNCVAMKKILPRCEQWVKESCLDHFDAINCAAASNFCSTNLADPYDELDLNPYDMSRECKGELKQNLCYYETKTIARYLDQPHVRTKLGVDPSITANFSSCAESVSTLFEQSMDSMHQTQHHIGALLERGIRALIYVGTYDWICNWVSNEQWTLNMEWSGREHFVKEKLREWTVDGQKAGLVRSKHGLTFVTVDSAGHMVPFDKPKESLALVRRQQFYNAGLFTPLEDLSLVSSHTYTTLSHPAFPRHSVRIKKTHEFCDPTVNSYAGYIDIEARHLFFYFFESRNDPDTDDVIFWTNGGPGGSSAMGLFMELGPCRVKDDNSTAFHPESWNENANIFFVDQPVGVGFSYAEYGETVGTTEEAAKDIASFVAIFFEHFSKFKGRAFHMAGESYAGRYVPVFAAEVYDQNARLVEAGLTPINLQSVMIGNGMFNFATLFLSYYYVQCTSVSLPPVMSISKCVAMKKILPRCEQWVKKSCLDHFDSIDCNAASVFCSTELLMPFYELGLNPYDMSRECKGELKENLCYNESKTIANYLNQPHVRAKLGVDPSIIANFSMYSESVNTLFANNMDSMHQTQHHIGALLERGIRALIYVGTYDWVCNWVSNERWTLDLEWSGREHFVKEELREWTVDGKKAGLVRSKHHGLTFATVDAAGHMVPFDKPKEALTLVQRWLAKQDI